MVYLYKPLIQQKYYIDKNFWHKLFAIKINTNYSMYVCSRYGYVGRSLVHTPPPCKRQ